MILVLIVQLLVLFYKINSSILRFLSEIISSIHVSRKRSAQAGGRRDGADATQGEPEIYL
jgi:hypothetical protein